MMIDFSLNRAQKMGGLTMSLTPGEYKPGVTPMESLYVSEKAFFFIEPTIRRYSTQYSRPFAHWGITAIPKEEWQMILNRWKLLTAELDCALSIDSVSEFSDVSEELKEEFDRDFTKNRSGLLAALIELALWLEQMLKKHSFISVVGV